MDKKRELMHKMLDDDATGEERALFARDIDADPPLREEFGGLIHTVRLLETSEVRQPPATFTADVMKRLPGRAPSAAARAREFLFGGRVLRWNMASALAAALLLVAAAFVLVRMQGGTVRTAATGPAGPTVTVRLVFHAPGAHSVAVAGEFNKWKTDADFMTGSGGVWSIDLKLKPGEYAYSFIVDGKTWVPDPGARTYEDDGFGSRNAVLRASI